MRITKEIAEKNVGRYYDKFSRHTNVCGAYPRLIIKFPDGRLAFKRMGDGDGVCSPFCFEDERQAEYADYFFDSLDECKE